MSVTSFKELVIESFVDRVTPRDDNEDLRLWAMCTLDIFRPAFIQTYYKLNDSEPLINILIHLYKYNALFTRYGGFKNKYISRQTDNEF